MTKNILVVDDEQCIRYTFQDFLSERGYRVSTAGSYDEALFLMRWKKFDLIIADVILPGRSGLELLRVVKQASPSTPVVVITGGPNSEMITEVQRLGASDYMVKPVRQEDLLRAADTALQQ